MIRRLRKFARLPAREQRLFLEALILAVVFRTALWFAPFRTTQRMLTHLGSARTPAGRVFSPEAVALAVIRATRVVPRATCLTQALTAKLLLLWNGYPATLRIGVGRDAEAEFAAHAWLEYEGRVIIGDGGLEQFTPLAGIEAAFD